MQHGNYVYFNQSSTGDNTLHRSPGWVRLIKICLVHFIVLIKTIYIKQMGHYPFSPHKKNRHTYAFVIKQGTDMPEMFLLKPSLFF